MAQTNIGINNMADKMTLGKAITDLTKEIEALKKINLHDIPKEHQKLVKDRIRKNETLILDYSFRLKNGER